MTFPVTAFISPGGGEFLLIMLVLILLFGAKDAPRILRSIQTFLDKTQRAAASFRYKIMYGDLHTDSSKEEPYDVEADYPDDAEESPNEPDEPQSQPDKPAE
jgi:Sec-independent protein translocase protein TatA